jgi:toxin FitB
MNIVDSSGWLEYFATDPNAGFFASAIKATENLVVPTICIYEVFKRLLTQRGEEDALQAIGVMLLGVVGEMTWEIAIVAAEISSELNMAMADSVVLATTRAYDATLWTQDADFKGMEGIRYIEKKAG